MSPIGKIVQKIKIITMNKNNGRQGRKNVLKQLAHESQADVDLEK